MRSVAQQNVDEARRNRQQQTDGGVDRAQEALAQAQADLDALRAQIKQQQQVDAQGAGAGIAGVDVGNLQNQIVGTFSAAAAVALGQGGSPAERMVRTLQEIRSLNRQQYEEQKELRRRVAQGGLVT